MKKQLVSLVGLGLLLATALASAQTVNLKAQIPFNFVVAGRELPSGEYTLRSLEGNSAISMRGADQKPTLFLANRCASVAPSAKTKLVFHRYGAEYFLSQIWMEGNKAGSELPKSAREIEAAENNTVQSVVVLAELR
jgi:hypothetical protein